MKSFTERATPVQLQWMVWGIVIIINFSSYLPMDGPKGAAVFTILNAFFYALIIYGNISFLYPRFYQTRRMTLYIILTAIFLIGIGAVRTWINLTIYKIFFPAANKENIFETFIYITLAGLVVYILSFVFRIALAYFALKRQAERILEQKSLAELNLLKSQVQPHFLFNTLNNIYYEAFRESPRTALLIGRLSEIMRYFVDESPKEKVTLTTEIQFLENYIALEKIRVRNGVNVVFQKEIDGDNRIPPMLLMTFVENIFKHGIDRSGPVNEVSLCLEEQNGYLLFKTENALPPQQLGSPKEGSGIKNLQKRLNLLYGGDFELTIDRANGSFFSFLKIPLA